MHSDLTGRASQHRCADLLPSGDLAMRSERESKTFSLWTAASRRTTIRRSCCTGRAPALAIACGGKRTKGTCFWFRWVRSSDNTNFQEKDEPSKKCPRSSRSPDICHPGRSGHQSPNGPLHLRFIDRTRVARSDVEGLVPSTPGNSSISEPNASTRVKGHPQQPPETREKLKAFQPWRMSKLFAARDRDQNRALLCKARQGAARPARHARQRHVGEITEGYQEPAISYALAAFGR